MLTQSRCQRENIVSKSSLCWFQISSWSLYSQAIKRLFIVDCYLFMTWRFLLIIIHFRLTTNHLFSHRICHSRIVYQRRRRRRFYIDFVIESRYTAKHSRDEITNILISYRRQHASCRQIKRDISWSSSIRWFINVRLRRRSSTLLHIDSSTLSKASYALSLFVACIELTLSLYLIEIRR